FEMMPPPDSHRALTPQQKETVRRWIEQGAAYQAHWSFIPPRKTPPPEVRNGAWPRGAIDRFVLAQLERQGLGPAPEADRRTLARRAALDLTGLPPSPEELAEFLADDRPDAYERLVDRLLASPHFGERLALVWLDAARYADTNGYSIDGGRHMWLWRDWVIDAGNRNMTYDQFLIEQLAGDLLPEPSPAQLIATGFQRNNMVTHEGGTIPEENLVNYNADRVKTLGEAVLGLTLGCAQCHDHKYDPISQREYYQLFAYFNTLGDIGLDGNAGVNPRPSIQARTVLDTGEAPQLRARIAELQRQLAEVDGDAVDRWAARQRRRLHERGRSLSIHGVTPLKVSTPNAGSGFDIENRRYVRITKPQDLVAFDVSLEMPQIGHPIEAVRIAFYPADDAPGGGFGFGQLDPPPSQEGESDAAGPQTPGTFVVTAISVSAESAPGDQVNLHRLQEFRQVTASSWRTEFRPETVLDPRDDGWAPRPGDASPRLTLTLQTPIDPAEAPYMTVQVNFGRRGSLVGARFEIQALTGADDDSELDAELIPIVLKTPEQRDPPETARLRSYYAQHAADAAPLR
ncbi:MAG TPA: DUF1549 domain-containing protein, partial [Lacipirellulaceae bacterium]|nr:DUF1549 domain-containing protein [Lacipirellulaceae bacterium]